MLPLPHSSQLAGPFSAAVCTRVGLPTPGTQPAPSREVPVSLQGVPMGRSFPFHLSVACALIAPLAGSRPRDGGIDTASRDSLGATTADTFTREADEVPVTTSSDEARTFYQRGRVLADQLRTHDARQQFEQAVAKDSGFALAHYDLALNAGSPREAVTQLDRAVALSSKASDSERLMILALQAGNTGTAGVEREVV